MEQQIIKPIILVVEDNRYFVDKMKKAFAANADLTQNYHLEIIGDSKQAQEFFDEHTALIDLIYLDYQVPGNPLGTSAALLEQIKASVYSGEIIAISSFMNAILMNLGCSEAIEKQTAVEDMAKRLTK
jgi:CheY-like chemotaxis protein